MSNTTAECGQQPAFSRHKECPMVAHDASQKMLFSHRQMVAGLLELGVGQDWVRQLDLSSLRPVPASHVSKNLLKRRGDLAWRARLPGGPVYILLEFQSRSDPSMPIRFPGYAGLLWQRLHRQKRRPKNRSAPPVFCLVLYNGDGRWTAPLETGELFKSIPEDLKPYQVRMRYFVVDVQRFEERSLKGRKNAFACLLRLERSRSLEEVDRVVKDLINWFGGEKHQALRQDMAIWLLHVLWPSRFPGLPVPDSVEDLAEMRSLLAERAKKWPQQWMEEGRKKGRRQGRRQGRREGRREGRQEALARLLLLQLEQKFEALPEKRRRQIVAADADTLLGWAGRVLTAESLEQVFNGHFSRGG
ncbi:MAG: Rpn family recombination-promoting nuclease/putative transposase [Acidobacteriota bacterium]